MLKTYIKLAFLALAVLSLPFYGMTQEASLGQYLRLATGSIYVQYARYSDNQRTKPVETKWVFFGSGWAYKSSDKSSIWVTNAHVVGNPPNRPDSKGRWWFPTGKYGVRLQGRYIVEATRVLKVDPTVDLAALEMPVRVPTVACVEDKPVLEEEAVLNVSFPLGIRYIIVKGFVIRRDDDKDYDVDEIDDFSGAIEGQYIGGHLWLDIRVTHGSSGSPVVLLRNGCLAGVIRGYWVAGQFVQMGEPMIYAIPSTTVLKFLKSVENASDNS
jgi:S1-C subfamily serine protease